MIYVYANNGNKAGVKIGKFYGPKEQLARKFVVELSKLSEYGITTYNMYVTLHHGYKTSTKHIKLNSVDYAYWEWRLSFRAAHITQFQSYVFEDC